SWIFGFGPADKTNVLPPEAFLFFNCLVGFFFVFMLWTAMISFQSLLPISDLLKNPLLSIIEAYRTSWHLLLHIFKKHGPAISVVDGKANTTSEDVSREGKPGVIVINFNSAVVLEERHDAPGINSIFNKLSSGILEAQLLVDASESPRVCAPGIVFTRPRERIRGVVDLRKQFRLQPRVHCYTREGIELYANILSIFTIGQDPDILQVTYHGEMRPENLRVITLDKRSSGFQRVTGFNDDLDDEDRKEIHEFALRSGKQADQPIFQAFSPLPNTSRQGFNRDRVFSAVFAQAKNSKQEILPWHELPIRVAASFYRELLLQINFDNLYDVKEKSKFPLPEYKTKLRLKMRNNGILAFRLVQHVSGMPLIRGRIYPEKDLAVSQSCTLTTSKLLRDRGIKVIFSGFGDLIPVSDLVYKQRLETWRIPWEEELDQNLANIDLQATRVSSRARSQAQQDIWRNLKQLLEQNEFTEEAMALRILQSLEQAASDPKTQALLPANAIDMMRHLQSLLLPPETSSQAINPPPPPAPAPVEPGNKKPTGGSGDAV
ncbi:MAG: hypothetical protein IH586_16310, partial [Anaerolineaceae bacterium]|nr:hypothetical protein [Anaerolineaceae bacterium]